MVGVVGSSPIAPTRIFETYVASMVGHRTVDALRKGDGNSIRQFDKKERKGKRYDTADLEHYRTIALIERTLVL